MITRSVVFYFDGGTAIIITDDGNYYIDRRNNSKTPMLIYDKYPTDNGASIVGGVCDELLCSLKLYMDKSDNSAAIKILIKDLNSVKNNKRDRK